MSDSQPKDDDCLRDHEYWRSRLTPEEFAVCRQQGTERPFSGEYNDFKGEGAFHCRCCGTPLFDATSKFDSGSGWPSFYATTDADCVQENFDDSHGMRRTEIVCRRCRCHLGHVFPDGPAPTGLRYCVNSLSIKHQAGDK